VHTLPRVVRADVLGRLAQRLDERWLDRVVRRGDLGTAISNVVRSTPVNAWL